MDDLHLGIETSTTKFTVALTEGRRIVSSSSTEIRDAMALDLRSMIQKTLDDCGRDLREVKLIVVDRGPGNLSAVRSGVAFANALASSARLPVVGASSFDLMYRSSTLHRDMQWLCLRKGSADHFYAGMVSGRRLIKQAYGSPSKIAERLQTDGEIAFAGVGADLFLPHLPNVRALDSGVIFPTLDGLVSYMCDPDLDIPSRIDLVTPVTEQAKVFDEQS